MAEILIGNIKGPKGDTGDTGATGATGNAATISVGTVSTTAYGQPAQVVNSGTSGAAVFDFVIPEGRPGDGLTDMSDMTNNTVTPSTSSYPIPSAGDTGRVLWGKVQKFFADIKNAVESKLNSANVVNNLTTQNAGFALDARQGKALNDSVTALRNSFVTRQQSYTPEIKWTDGSGLVANPVDFFYLRIATNVYWVCGRFNVTDIGVPDGSLRISYPPVGNTFVSTSVAPSGFVVVPPNFENASAIKVSSTINGFYIARSAGGNVWTSTTFKVGYYGFGALCFVYN